MKEDGLEGVFDAVDRTVLEKVDQKSLDYKQAKFDNAHKAVYTRES